MKKLLILLTLVYLTSASVQAKMSENNYSRPPIPPQMYEAKRIQHEQAFEQRLGLTEEQKQKSKDLRLEGREKIKPVIEQIKSRENEKDIIKKSDLDEKTREEKLNAIDTDLKTLHKQAHDIRVENMKNFEDILSPEQKKTLKEMKHEGRQEYNKKHIPPPPLPKHK